MAALAIASAAASAIGGVISAFGAIQEGNATARAAEYNASIADRNAVIAEQNRQANVKTALIDAEDKRRENRRVLSSIRAAYGSSGLDIAGSPLDVLEDTAFEQELTVQRIEYEGRVRSREGAIQILGLRDEAKLNRMEARSARSGGYVKAAAAVVGGAGNTLSRLA